MRNNALVDGDTAKEDVNFWKTGMNTYIKLHASLHVRDLDMCS